MDPTAIPPSARHTVRRILLAAVAGITWLSLSAAAASATVGHACEPSPCETSIAAPASAAGTGQYDGELEIPAEGPDGQGQPEQGPAPVTNPPPEAYPPPAALDPVAPPAELAPTMPPSDPAFPAPGFVMDPAAPVPDMTVPAPAAPVPDMTVPAPAAPVPDAAVPDAAVPDAAVPVPDPAAPMDPVLAVPDPDGVLPVADPAILLPDPVDAGVSEPLHPLVEDLPTAPGLSDTSNPVWPSEAAVPSGVTSGPPPHSAPAQETTAWKPASTGQPADAGTRSLPPLYVPPPGSYPALLAEKPVASGGPGSGAAAPTGTPAVGGETVPSGNDGTGPLPGGPQLPAPEAALPAAPGSGSSSGQSSSGPSGTAAWLPSLYFYLPTTGADPIRGPLQHAASAVSADPGSSPD